MGEGGGVALALRVKFNIVYIVFPRDSGLGWVTRSCRSFAVMAWGRGNNATREIFFVAALALPLFFDSFLKSQRCVERDAETPPAKAAPHQSLSLWETMWLEAIFRILFVLRVSYGGLERFFHCSSSHSTSYMAYRSVYWQSPHHSSDGTRLGSFGPNFWDTIRSRRKSMRHASTLSHACLSLPLPLSCFSVIVLLLFL